MVTQIPEPIEKKKDVRLRPLLLQMLIAILCSSVILVLLPIILWLIVTLWQYGQIPDVAGHGILILFLVIFTVFCFLPFNIFILMALHLSKIFQYIIYSKTLVIIESILFSILLLGYAMLIRVGEFLWMLLTGCTVLLLFLTVRLIFKSYYIKFRTHYQTLYNQTNPLERYAANKEVDIFLISALLIGAAISIGFVLSH